MQNIAKKVKKICFFLIFQLGMTLLDILYVYIFDSFRDISVHMDDFLKFVGVRVGVPNLFLDQSIGNFWINR